MSRHCALRTLREFSFACSRPPQKKLLIKTDQWHSGKQWQLESGLSVMATWPTFLFLLLLLCLSSCVCLPFRASHASPVHQHPHCAQESSPLHWLISISVCDQHFPPTTGQIVLIASVYGFQLYLYTSPLSLLAAADCPTFSSYFSYMCHISVLSKKGMSACLTSPCTPLLCHPWFKIAPIRWPEWSSAVLWDWELPTWIT